MIGKQQINTLEHTGFKYYWSEFNPTQKSEYLEAERAKDEMRDIMSRMIGAEIRYTQLGYWMHRPYYGFRSVKVDTKNGRCTILKPDENEAKFIIKLFEMRAAHIYTNQQIYNPEYPYKQVVACPKCGKILSGSTSRGKMGTYYPAYHCSRNGHYFRVPKPEFDKTLEDFVRTITVKP